MESVDSTPETQSVKHPSRTIICDERVPVYCLKTPGEGESVSCLASWKYYYSYFFLKVLAPLEYKNLKRAVSFEEHAHWQGKETHGGLTYTTVI